MENQPIYGIGSINRVLHKKKTITLFSTGQTMVSGQEPAELQKSWLICFAEYMISIGENPEGYSFELPNGQIAEIFKTENGYNYKLK